MSWKKIVSVSMVLIAVVAMAILQFQSAQKEVSGYYPLPLNLDIAYKEIQLRGMPPVPRYVIVATNSYNYFTTEDVFNSKQVPQKIGESLYRMPDGTLIGSLIK